MDETEPVASDISPATKRGSLGRSLQYIGYTIAQRVKPLISWIQPLEKTTIIFETFNGRSYACSPKALYECMLSDPKFKKYTFVWCFRYPEQYAFLIDNPRTKLVTYESLEYFHAYTRAKYWVVNSMIPLQIGKRKQQVMLQTWHGTPLKRLRGDIVQDTQGVLNTHDDLVKKNHLDSTRYDYFVVPSPRTVKNFVSAFALPVKKNRRLVLETGYPRNDFLHSYTRSEVATIRRRLKLPRDKKVILYAPTWRDDQYSDELGFVYEPPIDFARLRAELGGEYVVLFRAHYFVADTYDFSRHEGFVYNVSSVDDINELYIVSDVLITDYSSVLFDFANLQKPMLFFMYDRVHYQKELRGFYFPPEELPGDIVTTQTDLMNHLKDLEAYHQRTKSKLNSFHKTFNPLDDGRATQRVIEAVWGKKRR